MNIIRLYNQNRRQIFIVIFVIASIIIAIHFVNYLVKKDNNKNLSIDINSSSTVGTTTIDQSQQSNVSSANKVNKTKLIDDFIKCCNEGNVNSAYDLLSSSCKEVMFPTLEYFINNYYKIIFSEEKIYSVQNWTNSTYKISITENILATGKSNNGIVTEDYFTIVSDNGSNKLNINSFVGRTQLSRKNSKNNVEIEVIYIDTYMDYVICTLKVANDTNNVISLDSGESTQNMYVIDNNNIKNMSARNEVSNAELKILPYASREIQIKYLLSYISTRTMESLVFNDIILDFNTYKNYVETEKYTDRIQLKIEL